MFLSVTPGVAHNDVSRQTFFRSRFAVPVVELLINTKSLHFDVMDTPPILVGHSIGFLLIFQSWRSVLNTCGYLFKLGSLKARTVSELAC
jgi:hypothetical protein